MVEIGIPVLGHIGLTPQSVHQLGGFKVQGKGAKQAQKLVDDAKALEDAGAFAIVLECAPASLAALITQTLSIPTIGIGAGMGCDGQVLVWHDLLGLSSGALPRFVKQYAHLRHQIINALREYKEEVETSRFPEEKHSFTMDKDNLPRLDPDDEE